MTFPLVEAAKLLANSEPNTTAYEDFPIWIVHKDYSLEVI